MKRLTGILVGLLVGTVCLRAELSLEARIMTTGHFANGQKGLIVRAIILNQGPNDQPLHIMNCSWGWSWRLNENSGWEILEWECLANHPIKQTLAEGERMTFEIPIRALKSTSAKNPNPLRIGFTNSPHFDSKTPVIWSSPLALPPDSGRVLPDHGIRMERPPEQGDCIHALKNLVINGKNSSPNHFHVGPITDNQESTYAWVYWEERHQLILWDIDPGGRVPDLSLSRRVLDLQKDVVPTQADTGTSTYLVDVDWARQTVDDCIHLGRLIELTP